MKVVVPGNKTLIIPANSATTVAGAASNVAIIPKIEPDIQSNSTVDSGSSTATSANLQFQTPNNPVNNSSSLSGATKRPASLDLKSTTKKPRLVAPSPLQMDHPVNTPEVEKLILSNNLIQTPKPGVVFPQKLGQITTEQEEFGKGFEEALNNIHKQNIAGSTIATTGVCMSGGAFTYTKLDNIQVAIKDEPPNPPASPGNVQPIDMETQEQIKLERKRQRNRVAASKCRKRKLERISKLEDKVKDLKNENNDLSLLIKNLKDNVAKLKQEVVEHVNFGCEISMCHLIQAK